MPRRTWSALDDQFLRDHLHLSRVALAAELSCTVMSVKSRLRKLGLKLQNDGRLKPGNTPPYKGKKVPEALRMNNSRTWFQKGSKPHNTKHVGYISARRDSSGRMYFWIITAPRQYKHLHRHLWEAANGPVKPGHRICFKDGDQGNCVLSNLEEVTNDVAMARNTIGRYPKEIQDVMRTLGRLNQHIKNHGKEQDERSAEPPL